MDRKSYQKSYNKAYYWKNPEQHRERVKLYRKEHLKEVREKQKQWYNSDTGKKWLNENAEKNRVYQKEWMRNWRKNNPDKVKAIGRSDGAKERARRYREKHRIEIRKKSLEYNKIKIKTDPNARMKWLLRSRVNSAIKKQCGLKAYKTMELVGCTVQEVRDHLEKQFTPEMNWKNHGKEWEIDHKIPVAKFDLTNPEEQKKCFHYTNLQPLNWLENRKKQDRIVG